MRLLEREADAPVLEWLGIAAGALNVTFMPRAVRCFPLLSRHGTTASAVFGRWRSVSTTACAAVDGRGEGASMRR